MSVEIEGQKWDKNGNLKTVRKIVDGVVVYDEILESLRKRFEDIYDTKFDYLNDLGELKK